MRQGASLTHHFVNPSASFLGQISSKTVISPVPVPIPSPSSPSSFPLPFPLFPFPPFFLPFPPSSFVSSSSSTNCAAVAKEAEGSRQAG